MNTRTDTYWLGDGGHAETCRRLNAYQSGGADGVFVPGLSGPGRITGLLRTFDVPLNILYSPIGPTVAQLGGLGACRVSLGFLLYWWVLGAALEAASDIRAGRLPHDVALAYAEVQARSAADPDRSDGVTPWRCGAVGGANASIGRVDASVA